MANKWWVVKFSPVFILKCPPHLTTHHLLAIYSGGLVDLDGQGLSQPEDQMPGYGTGKLDR
jgi:hypothetical protein